MPEVTKAPTQKLTVGRIVHFYNEVLVGRETKGATYGQDIALNGQGAGPYAAVVVQTFENKDGHVTHANLSILAYGGSWTEGSVSEKSENCSARYWEYPPRV